jgi:hypothetical protein
LFQLIEQDETTSRFTCHELKNPAGHPAGIKVALPNYD